MADLEMVEKVAEAIWQSDATLLYMPEEYRKMARAVIAVQHEPTEAMQRAIYSCSLVPPGMTEQHARTIWRAMNRAALGEDDG